VFIPVYVNVLSSFISINDSHEYVKPLAYIGLRLATVSNYTNIETPVLLWYSGIVTINENLIRISAVKAPIDSPLEIGTEVTIGARGTVVKTEDTDNDDGTIDRTYVIKVEFAEDYTVKAIDVMGHSHSKGSRERKLDSKVAGMRQTKTIDKITNGNMLTIE
jgi:hypothetical protein